MTRRIIAVVFVLVCWLGLPKYADATLNSGCFTPHYTSYTNRTTDSNHNIIQTVQVSGYTEALNPAVYMGPQAGWQYPCSSQTTQMQSATHTSNIRNVVGSTGGNYSQGPTPALNYNNYSITLTAPATPGTIYVTETNTDIICIIAAGIFTWPWSGHVEVAYTRAIQIAGQMGTNCADGVGVATICDFQIGNWCTANTTPPDMSLTKIRYDIAIDGYPWGWEAYGVVYRAGTSGPWNGGTNLLQFAFPDYAALPLAFCSYHP